MGPKRSLIATNGRPPLADVKDVAPRVRTDWGSSTVEMSMIRRLFSLVALLFYGSIDRVTGLMSDDLDYPDDDDALASPPRLAA